MSFAYDQANRPSSTTLPNGIVQAHGYDPASRLTSIDYDKATRRQVVPGKGHPRIRSWTRSDSSRRGSHPVRTSFVPGHDSIVPPNG